MMQLNEMELKKLIQGGETNTVELKVTAQRSRTGVDWDGVRCHDK